MKLKNLFIFAAGAVVGAAVAANVVKTKYEQLIEEEVQSVKDMYKRREENKEEKEPKVEEEIEEIEVNEEEQEEYNKVVENLNYNTGYFNYGDAYKQSLEQKEVKKEIEEVKEKEIADQFAPYIIDPEEFGNDGEYDTVTWSYYADGILRDEVDDQVDDIEAEVGLDFIDIFRDFDATSVCVRNDSLEMDIEILRCDWFYSSSKEVLDEYMKKPHQL